MGVDTGIGPTLREARNRRKIDLSEVETAIKIRVRYLQAIENEEWDALPGGAYTRGFIRTYASFLGLDGERLAEDYRRSAVPDAGDRVPKRVEPVPTGARRPRPQISARLLIVVVCVALVALAVGIALAGGDGGPSGPSSATQQEGKQGGKAQKKGATTPSKPGVGVRLAATGEVWVCVVGAAEKPLVDGQILAEGEEVGPFRSREFEMAFGNGLITVYVDERPVAIEQSSSPVGYAVDSKGELTALEEGERPSCE